VLPTQQAMQSRALLLIGAVVAGGCGYQPAFRNRAVVCAAASDCPAGFACGAEGLCVGPGTSSCSEDNDAQLVPDGPDPSCACTDQDTLTCASGTTACSLGCTGEAGAAHCNSFLPSNGASDQHFVGVTAALELAPGEQVRIDTTNGEIKSGSSVVRPAGFGVVAGIGFYPLDDAIAVFAVTSVEIGAGALLRGRGTRGLVLLSAGDVTVSGVLDVSAGCENGDQHCPGPGGTAGSTSSATSEGCGAGGDSVAGSQGSRRGGGGAGYGENGTGPGCGATSDGIPGEPGSSCGLAELDPLQGGFGGGGAGPQAGGGGGGAIQLTSKTAIRFVGTTNPIGIHAGGAGGDGGPASALSAGGGGSGGGILVEAPTVTFSAKTILAANGGGGAGNCLGNTKPPAEDGRFDTKPAAGGGCEESGCCGSLLGGSGGSRGSPPSKPDSCGSGGGGGVGRIRINSIPAGTSGQGVTFSPEPTFGFITASGG